MASIHSGISVIKHNKKQSEVTASYATFTINSFHQAINL